ncbi:hypothetical protein IW262DRAFT_1365083 [Armillaria fumosa]|nr:hypothetical protein IW262DRAFT_1365083 [Armillaria fumosa]
MTKSFDSVFQMRTRITLISILGLWVTSHECANADCTRTLYGVRFLSDANIKHQSTGRYQTVKASPIPVSGPFV